MIATAISMPPQALPYTLDTSPNIFRERFGALSIEQWRDLLVESMRTQVIGDVEFPRFPPTAIQEQIHGQSGEPAINEAFAVYAFVKKQADPAGEDSRRTARFSISAPAGAASSACSCAIST
jgi:hypothetical protein